MQHFKWLPWAGLLLLLIFTSGAPVLAQGDVEFRVDMRVMMEHDFFRPQDGDNVYLTGNFSGWNGDFIPDRQLSDPDGDSVYSITLGLPAMDLEYKFYKSPRGGLMWELNPNPSNPPWGNRQYTIVAGTQILPVVFFDNYNAYNDLVPINVTFRVEMGPYIAIGMFNPTTDQVKVPLWFPEPLTPSGTIYSITAKVPRGISGSYKYQISTPGAANNGWEAWVGEERQYGNRLVSFGMTDETLPLVYFNNYNPNDGLTTETEPNGKPGQSNTIVMGETLTGEISAVEDVDYYILFAKEGDTIRVKPMVDQSSPLDYRMTLHGRDGGGYASAYPPYGMTLVVPYTDVYYIRFSTAYNGDWFPTGAVAPHSGGGAMGQPQVIAFPGKTPTRLTNLELPGTVQGFPTDNETVRRKSDPRGRETQARAQGPTGSYSISLTEFVPGPPIINYGWVWDIVFNSGRFYFEMDPNGLETTLEVEWGTTIGYGEVFDPKGNTLDGVGMRGYYTDELMNLQPSTEYHFRLRARNALGEAVSGDQGFSTPPEPTLWAHQETPAQSMADYLGGSWGIAARDQNVYLAAGAYRVFRTTDGGSTWVDKSSEIDGWIDGRAIAFASSSVACIVGYGWIQRSTDAGDTWTRATVASSPYREVYDVSFPVPGVGIGVGYDGVILRSTDEGASWQEVQLGAPYALRGLAMIDALNGIAVGDYYGGGGVVIRTSDGGVSWTPSTAPSSTVLYDVQWISPSVLVMAGLEGTYNSPAIFATTDGGATWESSNIPGEAIACVDAKNWIAVGWGGQIHRTTDGGKNWVRDESGTNNALFDVIHVSGRFLAVGEWGTIMKSIRLIEGPIATTGEPTEVTENAAKLNGTVNPSGTITTYYFEYGPTDALGSKSDETILSPGTADVPVSFLLEGLEPGRTYFYRLTAKNVSGTSRGNILQFKTISDGLAPPVTINGGFESGLDPWVFHTDAEGSVSSRTPGPSSPRCAHITLQSIGQNMQLYQSGLKLEPGELYRLTFTAKSSKGHNLAVYLHKNNSPYTPYGLTKAVFDLTTEWKTFSIEFRTTGFASPVSDGRIRFWFVGYASAADQYYIDDVILQKTGEQPPPPGLVDAIINPGFETGLPPWTFYTNGGGTCISNSPGPESPRSAHITITKAGSNVQLYQTGLKLYAGARYRLTFSAYASTGHDLSVYLQKEISPYTAYGISRVKFDLENAWKTFTWEFTTSGFTGSANDGMLRIWLAPYAVSGDVYGVDNVHLEQLPSTLAERAAGNLVKASEFVPVETRLSTNFPNPFNPSTTIEFSMATAGEVHLEVFNTLGERVATLASGWYDAGQHMLTWHATSDRGAPLPSGVYFARMQAGDYFATQRMLLLK